MKTLSAGKYATYINTNHNSKYFKIRINVKYLTQKLELIFQRMKQTHMQKVTIPAGNYMFKVNNRNTRRCETGSKLTIKTPERPL